MLGASNLVHKEKEKVEEAGHRDKRRKGWGQAMVMDDSGKGGGENERRWQLPIEQMAWQKNIDSGRGNRHRGRQLGRMATGNTGGWWQGVANMAGSSQHGQWHGGLERPVMGQSS